MTETKILWHCCIALDKLLELTRQGENVLSYEDRTLTEYEVYKLVNYEKEKGYTYFAACDNRNIDGRCGGHFAG